MPSLRKSTRTESRPAPEGPDPSDLALLGPAQLLAARAKALALVRAFRQAGRPIPGQSAEYAVALGVLASQAEAEAIAARLVPDLTSEQAHALALAKERIGRLATALREARAEVRAIVGELRAGRSGKAGEPPFLECREARQLASLRPGRRYLDLTGALTGAGPGWVFTSPADDLAAELLWATETEDQLAEMVSRLSELAKREESDQLLRRRNLLASRLSPGDVAKSSAA